MTEERQPLSEFQKEQSKTEQPKSQHIERSVQTLEWDGIPVDIYRYFSVEVDTLPARELEKLKKISERITQQGDTIGDVLGKLSHLERKLGSPRLDETRYDKIYNWLMIQGNIDELKKRQDALQNRITL